MNQGWWLGLAPAQATVDCGGHAHRLRWADGDLRALDHGDAETERTLAALGGQRCTCMDLLEAWERHSDDLRVLVLASRGPADKVVVEHQPTPQARRPQAFVTLAPARQARQARQASMQTVSRIGAARPALQSGWTAYGPSGRASKQAEEENALFALLGLGGGIPERLVATVAAASAQRLRQRDRTLARIRPQLRAALHGRVLAALNAWLGRAGVESELKMIGEDDEASLTSREGVVHAELPFGWLVDVWSKDLATIWGRFCVGARTADGRTWRLTTVGPDLGRPSLVTLELSDDVGR